MSSNLKVNTILPSTGTTIGIGTVGGLINVVGNIDVNSTSGISTFNGLEISGIVTAKAGAAVTYYGDGSNLTGLNSDLVNDTSPQLGGNLDTNSHEISLDTSHAINFGDSNELRVFYHSGNGQIDFNGTTSLQLKTPANKYFQVVNRNTGDNIIQCQAGGEAGLYHNGTKTAYTHNSGFNIKGNNTSDNTELQIFGNEGQAASILMSADDGDDNADHWRMYSNADNSFTLNSYAGGSYQSILKGTSSRSIELNYQGSKKFETTSTGATLTGDLYATSRLLVNTTSPGESNGDEATFANTGGNAGITIRSAVNSECKIYFSEGTSGGSQYRGAINYNQNTNYMSFSANETEKMRILGTGGITFNGDTATANALDDYEEGLYVPTVTGSGSGSATLNSSFNNLSYTKIGNWCHVAGRVRIVSENMSGTYVVVTLPFTSANLAEDAGRHTGVVMIQYSDQQPNNYCIHPRNNQANFQIARGSSGDDMASAGDQFNGNELISVAFSFRTT